MMLSVDRSVIEIAGPRAHSGAKVTINSTLLPLITARQRWILELQMQPRLDKRPLGAQPQRVDFLAGIAAIPQI